MEKHSSWGAASCCIMLQCPEAAEGIVGEEMGRGRSGWGAAVGGDVSDCPGL